MRRKTEFVHKTTLLLDLDETTFIALSQEQFLEHGHSAESIKTLKKIHSSHTLSSAMKGGDYYFFVINPQRLKAMIESVYNQGDDIAIFTSGLWLSPVLDIVSQLCNLDKQYAFKLQQSLFLNPQHDGEKLGYTAELTRTLLKGYRLHGLFRSMATLRRRHFVLLDNSSEHINSCKEVPYMTGVLAATYTEDKSFYDLALQEMQRAHSKEVVLSPEAISYEFSNAIFTAFLELEKLSDTQQPTL